MMVGEDELIIRCPSCADDYGLPLDGEQMTRLYEYEHGHGYIQEMFKELNAVEREFIKTGLCPKCQVRVFGNGESKLLKRVYIGKDF